MNKNGKFVKEKLKTLDVLKESVPEDLDVSDELYDKCIQLAQQQQTFTFSVRKRNVSFIAAVATCIVVGIIFFICFLLPRQSGGPRFYQDKDLKTSKISYEQLISEHSVLLQENISEDTMFYIFKDKSSGTNVYCSSTITDQTGILKFTIVFVKNYQLFSEDSYNNLRQKGNTELFNYSYDIYNNSANAKFEYGGYKYYLNYNSTNPENITDIINSLQSPKLYYD